TLRSSESTVRISRPSAASLDTSVEAVLGTKPNSVAASRTEIPGWRPTKRSISACDWVSPVASNPRPVDRRSCRRNRPTTLNSSAIRSVRVSTTRYYLCYRVNFLAKSQARHTPVSRARLWRHGVRRLRQYLATVDGDGLTRDVTGLVAGEKRRGVADVFWGAERAGGDHPPHPGQIILAEIGQPFGEDVARQHRVDRDLVRCEFDRRGAHETQLGGLGCAVVRPAGKPGDRAGDRRRQHDAAPASGDQRIQAGLHA